MKSKTYEFSIKMGAIICRHPNMMHLDLTNVGFQSEEVVFIGLALSMSKTMLAIHLSGNHIPYYSRVMLRTLIAARVDYRYKDERGANKIKNNKEFSHVMQLANPDNYSLEMQDYINNYN
jgi:hypothetical protein